jgi:hypothetical protein
MLDDSALRECDESRGTRYSERHFAHYDAGSGRWLLMAARVRSEVAAGERLAPTLVDCAGGAGLRSHLNERIH